MKGKHVYCFRYKEQNVSNKFFKSEQICSHFDVISDILFCEYILLCRYKIYAEGYAWSVSLKYILSCGSLPLIISPEYEDFFSRGLFPKKNYWPVAASNLCSSIKYAVDWGNENLPEVWFLCFITSS